MEDKADGGLPLISENKLPSTRQQKQSLAVTTKRDNRADWTNQLKDCIGQAFDVFNTYGRQPEAAATILQAFALILADYPAENIRQAMIVWMRKSPIMPTPHDILTILEEDPKTRMVEKWEWKEVPRGTSGPNIYTFAGKSWIKERTGKN